MAILERLIKPPFRPQAKILNFMGECYLNLGDSAQAAESFSQAMEINPRFLKSYKNMADLMESMGNLSEACRYLEKAQFLSPLNTERLLRLGQLCLQNGDGEQAQKYLEQTLKAGHSIPETCRTEAAELFLQAGLDAVAEDLFTKSIQQEPGNINLYNRLGIALRRQKKHREALTYYHQALKIAPKSEKIYFNIGILYFDLGEKDNSRKAFQTALQIRPDFTEARDFLNQHFSPGKDSPT